MAKKKQNLTTKVGAWSFLIGFLIAVILGIFGLAATSILLILGLIVGLLNITDKEIVPFLVAAIALVVVGNVPHGLGWLSAILNNVNIFVLPAAVVAALKAIYALGRD